jgi:predicted phage terminase large subunit-like protein
MNKKELQKEKIMVQEMEKSITTLTNSDKIELLRLRCRTDFLTFARYVTSEVPTSGKFQPFKVHELIGSYLQKIGDGEKEFNRTAISLPPRTGKSLLISKVFPAWQLGRSPSAQFIMASYALKLSNENSRAVLDFVTSDAFKWIFPECPINPEKCNLKFIRSGAGGLIMVGSALGGVTGFGFGVISEDELPGVGILDDLLEDGNSIATMESTFSWAQTQFLTRGLPNNAIISMGTRFHVDDVIGRLLKADPDRWRELNVPALCTDEEGDPLGRKLGESHWPEFFPVFELESIKRQGEAVFDTLYQGRPMGEQGAIFKNPWFQFHETNYETYDFIYATIDTAYKAETRNDFTAVCIWGYHRRSRKLHLIHVIMEKLEFPDLQKLIPQWMDRWKVRCLYMEGRANGIPLMQSFKKDLNITVKELVPNKDKVLRANAVAPIVEDGRVSLYKNLPYLPERLSELTSFPFIKNDDFVDAFVYGVQVYRDEIMGAKAVHGGDRTRLPQMNSQVSHRRPSLGINGVSGRTTREATKWF